MLSSKAVFYRVGLKEGGQSRYTVRPPQHVAAPMFKKLHLTKITDTLDILQARISERFADCGLLNVCIELNAIARASEARIIWITRPNRSIRAGLPV